MKINPLWTDHFAPRPDNTSIDTLVIHSMYHPEAKDCYCPLLCRDWLDHCGVSAHYLIDRNGQVWQTVLEKNMAWHAGESQMPFADDQRTRVNDFSIGVELLASETSGILDAQYSSLALLCADIVSRHALAAVVGHSQIAPTRKTDPWQFDWVFFQHKLNISAINHKLRFLGDASGLLG